MYKPTYKSYFSGAGGLDCGFNQAGLMPKLSLEIDSKAVETLKLNHDHEIRHDDICQTLVKPQPKADISAFTYPCTKYSAIADIHGARTGDELFLHALRHMAIDQPEMYVIENVPGMKKFPIVMEAMTQMPNYHVTILSPVDAANWLPQKRDRLIIIGTKKAFDVDLPTLDPNRIRLKDIIESNPDVTMTKGAIDRLHGKYRDKPIVSDPSDPNAMAPCCVAHYHKDRGTRLVLDESFDYGVRPYTPREYARLQGFPDHYKFFGTSNDIYKQVGNAVAVHVAKWIGLQAVRYFNFG
jgi:DNA (cytosine-5)-methyltransferase 1